MIDRDPPHYLRQLQTTTVPRRLLWLDCASKSRKQNGGFIHSWNGGVLGTTHWTSRKREQVDTLKPYTDASEMWADADKFCTGNRRVVLWAYDLAYQLRLSRGLIELPKLGWTLKRIVLERTSAWASFQDDERSLLMCDLKAWAPVELGRLAADTKAGDVPSRSITAGRNFQRDVCMWHCRVVRDATMQILDWIEGEDLGQFRPTGSGQSYAAFRRRFLQHKLLVHDDTVRLAAERAAMWTGRCEAWRHGRLTRETYIEYDMRAAYATIANDSHVPTVARRHHTSPSLDSAMRRTETHSVLALCTITTQVPCIPAALGERTAWPTGTFTSWLWDPELKLAAEYADKVKVHECYTYDRAPALREFARFVLDGMAGGDDNTPAVARRVMKHWSRCLVGRLGLRYRAWEPFAATDDVDLQLVNYIDSDDGTMTDLLVAGREWMILGGMREALESLPQIPSWVMSECRRRLWQAMFEIGLDRVVYLDTDSLIVQATATTDLAELSDYFTTRGWTHKGTYSTMTIHGPRNYETSRDRKVAGLPLTARQVAPLEFTGEVMRSIKESMRAGQLDCVASLPRTFKLNPIDMRRQHLPYGATKPFDLQPIAREYDE